MSKDDHSTVAEWLNNAAITSSTTDKVNLLHKAKEFLLRKCPQLLMELLPDFLGFSSDRNGDVKKCVVGFIEEACKKNEKVIPHVLLNLHMLLCEEPVQVQKRVIQASGSIYRNMMTWLSKAQDITEEMEQAWQTLNRLKIEILNMIDSDNDGIRTNSIKFLEVIILLQTYPDSNAPRKDNDFSLEDVPLTLKFARRRKLEEEAVHIFSLLINFHGSQHISSVNLMACMGSLCNIAKLRPQFMSKVIEALENLLSSFPPTLSDSQVSSVKKHLKIQLINILKHPTSVEYRSSITSMLTDIGCSNQELARIMPRLPPEDKKRVSKRVVSEPIAPPPTVKKPRLLHDIEIKSEETVEKRQQALDTNRQFVLDHLNMNVIMQLVFVGMKNLPNTMPPNFAQDYLKHKSSKASLSMRDLAKILAEHFLESNVGPGAKIYTCTDPPKSTLSIINTTTSSTTTSSTSVSSVSTQQQHHSHQHKHDMPPEPLVTVKEEKIDPGEKFNFSENNIKEPVIKSGRVSKSKVKTLKLAEVTRPLKREARELMLLSAVRRLLHSEKAASRTGVALTRFKIITTLAASYDSGVRDTILKFLLSDLRSHIDLALAWLYEEYSLMQGFNRVPSVLKKPEKPDQNYNTLLCSLVNNLKTSEIKDRDGLLARLYLEAPMITEEALKMLKEICARPERCVAALNLLHDLVIRRPPKGSIYLNTLLAFTTSDEDITVRDEAIARVTSLYERIEWQKCIEKYALEYMEMLQLPKPPELLFETETGTAKDVWTDDLNRACLSLYLALLPYNETLIHELARVYTQTSADIKRTILRLLEQPIKGMGMDSPELLMLVEECPKGAETLVTRIIHILSDRGTPSAQLVQKVRELYQSRIPDVRFLIPVLNGLTKKEVTNALPKLIKLNPVVVKEVFNRLLGLHGDSPMTPSELLIALHMIDPSKAELKAVMKATSLCFAEKQVYTQEVLAVVIQQLMEINPLPTLLMRTVIQSLSLYPRLTGFVMNVLQRLIVKQVWRQKVVWEGFIKCCQRTKPQSFQVLLQLPPPQLTEALNVCPDMKQPLLEHVQSFTEAQRAHVPASTMEVLTGSTLPPKVPPTVTPPLASATSNNTPVVISNNSTTNNNTITTPTPTTVEEPKEIPPLGLVDEPLPPGME